MQDELKDKNEDYCFILHEDWCDLLSTMGVKYNSKRAASQIKRLISSKGEPINCDSNKYNRVTHKKKVRTGVLPDRKHHGVMADD